MLEKGRLPVLLFVTGKGGVGKTTVSAALAMMLARSGKKVLLMEIGETESVGSRLGVTNYGHEGVRAGDGIHVCRVTPESCLREYGLRKLKIERLYRLVFENGFVRALLAMLPGMEDLLVIGKIGFMVQQIRTDRSASHYDHIVVDAPPTGQGAGVLSVPTTVLMAVRAGPVAREVGELQALLADPTRTGIMVVTSPEELAVDEALELEQRLLVKDGFPGLCLVVNKVIRAELSLQDRDVIAAYVHARRARGAFSNEYVVLDTCLKAYRVQQEQTKQTRRLRARSELPIITLPLLAAPEAEEVTAKLSGLLKVMTAARPA